MEQKAGIYEMLDLMLSPAFCVEHNTITRRNQAAARLFLREGLSLEPLFESGAEEYRSFSGGILYVTLSICSQSWGASVVRIGAQDVFTLDQEFESEQLRVLALAARELRGPLSNAMLMAQQLTDAPQIASHVSRLNRGLHQMLRIVGNMSDASGSSPVFRPELRNADALFREIVEKAAALASDSGNTIRYAGLDEDVTCMLDAQLLERAALNMISNAMKFSEPNSDILVSLNRVCQSLRLSVSNRGSGIPEDIQSTLFRRYLREPVIEDSRHGIGLGMLLIRNAAAKHGGAVLVDQPEKDCTRISVTLSTVFQPEEALHISRLNADYAGGQDHALLELSDILPPDLF